MKFGSGCVVSLLLMQVPVLFKGWRHFAFFMTAVALLQATSVVFDALEAHVRGAVTLSSHSEQLAPLHCSLPSHTCAPTPSPLSPSYLSDHHPSKRSGIFVSLSLQPLRCISCGSAFTSSSGWFQTRQGTGRCGPRQLSLLSKGPRFSAAQSDGAGAYTFHTLMTFGADIHLHLMIHFFCSGGVTLREGTADVARALLDWRTLLQTFWPTLGCLASLLASRTAAAPPALHSRRGAWVVAAQAFLMVLLSVCAYKIFSLYYDWIIRYLISYLITSIVYYITGN